MDETTTHRLSAPSARSARAALLALALLLCPLPARAQDDDDADPPEEPAPAAAPAPDTRAPGDDLTISILTFGPGDHPFDKFGHNALWIQDASTGKGHAYNFGTFSFRSPLLIPQFFMGRFRYWLSRRTYQGMIFSYKKHNRSIEVQELDLTADQKREIKRRLEENLKPENKYYKYDYYADNCSTRVRDLLDDVTGQRVRAAAEGPGAFTYRQHTSRLVADYFPEYFILNAVMGPFIDQPITQWEEMFLPAKLQEGLRRATVPGPAGDRPLVKREEVIFAASRPPPRAAPPAWTPRFGLAGALFGGALALLGHLGARRRGARIALGAVLSPLGLFLGFFGCFYLFAWAVTDHVVGYRNANILQFAPWSILLTGYGVGVARGKPRAVRAAFALVAAAAVASLAGLLLAGVIGQENGDFIALLLPLWAGAAFGTWRLRGALAVV